MSSTAPASPGTQACDAMTCDDVRNAHCLPGINETKMRLEAPQIVQAPLLRERFRWSEVVVRDRIELSTFRFSGVRMTVQGSPCWSILPVQSAVIHGDRRRYTNMYETRNETNRSPVHGCERKIQAT
jgi:hypothetical protein